MSLTIGLLLALSFLTSLMGLAALIRAVANRQLTRDKTPAFAIFVPGEAGISDDANMVSKGQVTKNESHFDLHRSELDAISRLPVLILLSFRRRHQWNRLGAFHKGAFLVSSVPRRTNDGQLIILHISIVFIKRTNYTAFHLFTASAFAMARPSHRVFRAR